MTHLLDLDQLAQHIKQWGQSLGFQQVGICDTDLSAEEPKLQEWLDKQYHGEMDWMARHGMMRARPHELLPGTLRVISVRMNYLPAKAAFAKTLNNPMLGYVSRYAPRLSQGSAPASEKAGRHDPDLLHRSAARFSAELSPFC
jgi:epoxyqueuosine reductase